jgi:hypothetical protein
MGRSVRCGAVLVSFLLGFPASGLIPVIFSFVVLRFFMGALRVACSCLRPHPRRWNADEYKLVMDQMAKLNFNFLGLHTYPLSEPTVWTGRVGLHAACMPACMPGPHA